MKKMIDNSKPLVLIALLCMLNFSCEKDLDLEPKSSISSNVFFASQEDFKLWANQFYFDLPSFTFRRDDWSDITYQPGGNTISRGQHQVVPTDNFWGDTYWDIRKYNTLLEEAAEAPEDIKSSIAVYEAEAKFFRAFAYFSLLRRYGGVPIVDKVLDLNSEELFAARNTREEVVNFILRDLDEAVAVLPLPSDLSGQDLGRVTSGTAYAFKSRVALFEGTWAKYHGTAGNVNDLLTQAIDAANQVIAMEGSGYELFDKPDLAEESYFWMFTLDNTQQNPGNYTKADNREVILENRFDSELRSHRAFPNPIVSNNPTKAYVDLVLCADGLPIEKSPLFMGYDMVGDEYVNRDPRMTTSLMIPFQRYHAANQDLWQIDWSDPGREDRGFLYEIEIGLRTQTGYNIQKLVPTGRFPAGHNWAVIRYAEVLLNFAEATYELNGSISDEDLNKSINKLRQRVRMPAITGAFASTNGLDMLEEIRRERTVELFAEGFRYDDLRRWKIAEIELPKAIKGIKYTGTQYETDPRWSDLTPEVDANGFFIVESASVRQFDPNKHYLFPIPRNEIAQNDALAQNPGWQ